MCFGVNIDSLDLGESQPPFGIQTKGDYFWFLFLLALFLLFSHFSSPSSDATAIQIGSLFVFCFFYFIFFFLTSNNRTFEQMGGLEAIINGFFLQNNANLVCVL